MSFPSRRADNCLEHLKDLQHSFRREKMNRNIDVKALINMIHKEQDNNKVCVRGRNSEEVYFKLHFATIIRKIDELNVRVSENKNQKKVIKELLDQLFKMYNQIQLKENVLTVVKNQLSACEKNRENHEIYDSLEALEEKVNTGPITEMIKANKSRILTVEQDDDRRSGLLEAATEVLPSHIAHPLSSPITSPVESNSGKTDFQDIRVKEHTGPVERGILDSSIRILEPRADSIPKPIKEQNPIITLADSSFLQE